jgi:DNA-binding transcriptional LysR family regulator
MMALDCLSRSDLIAALPRRLVRRHAARFGLAFVDLPFKRKSDSIEAVTTKASMKDAGIAWLIETAVALSAADRQSIRPA